MLAPIRPKVPRWRLGLTIVVGLGLVVAVVWLAVPVQYAEGQTVELATFDGSPVTGTACVEAPATVTFTWVVGNAVHNGSTAANGGPFVATLTIWPSAASAGVPSYQQTGPSGSGTFPVSGPETFQATGLAANDALWVDLTWNAPGHLLGGPTASLAC